LAAVKFPIWHGKKVGIGFHEVNARASDFAFVSAAAQVDLGADGNANDCHRRRRGHRFPMRLESAERQLQDSALDAKT
jgi:hypothetical protein